MSVLLSLLLTLRTPARSRAALQLEILALQHQLQALQGARPRRATARQGGPRWLWVVLSRVWTETNGSLLAVPARILGRKGSGDSVTVEFTFDADEDD